MNAYEVRLSLHPACPTNCMVLKQRFSGKEKGIEDIIIIVRSNNSRVLVITYIYPSPTRGKHYALQSDVVQRFSNKSSYYQLLLHFLLPNLS